MKHLSVKDIAKDLGLGIRAVQKYINEGFLPARRDLRLPSRPYVINPTEYYDWKEKYFSGVPSEKISKCTRLDKGPSKAELLTLIKKWLDSLNNGSYNGKIYSQATIETYNYHIKHYLAKLGKNPPKPIISQTNLEKVFLEIGKDKYATRRKVYDTLICFTSFLIAKAKQDQSIQDDIRKIKPKRFKPAVKTTLDVKQTELLLDTSSKVTGNTAYDKLLNKTLIVFMQSTGLRANEVCNLELKDIDLVNRTVQVWLGKGNKNRKVGINDKCYQAIEEYLVDRKELRAKKAKASSYAFIGRKGNQLNRHTLRRRWARLSKRLGFKITNHANRRNFVTLNAANGVPLDYIRIAAGHSDLSTTQGYLMTSENEVLEAMKKW